MKFFTQDDARGIAKKLGGTIEKRKRHDWAVIRYQGQVVAQYGIRRSSREADHAHIPKQLHISKDTARGLADCPVSKAEYFDAMRAIGKIPRGEEDSPCLPHS